MSRTATKGRHTMDPHELLLTAVRAVAVYLLVLVVIRALGKRTVGNFAAFDLLVALMIGEVVDEIVYGDVSFLQGTTVIVIVGAMHAGNAWLSARGRGMEKLLEGEPTPIIRDGELLLQGMKKERMNVRDVMAHLRLHGIRDLREVRLAAVEDDGEISVLLQEWAETAKRADVDREAARQRKEPEPEFATDAAAHM